MRQNAIYSGATVARNSLILLVGQIFSQAITLILGIAITRALGATEYGRYVSAFAFATVFVSFTSLGLEKRLVWDMSRHSTDAARLFCNAGSLRLVLSFATYVLMIATSFLLRFTNEQRRVILLAGLVVELTSLGDLMRTVFQAFERMEFDTLSRLIERAVAVVLIVAVLLRWRTAGAVSVALLVANLIAVGYAFLIARHFVRFEHKPSWKTQLTLLQVAVPFGITSTVVGVLTRLDPLFLSMFRSATEVGWYGAAMNLLLPLTMLPQAFSSSLFPRLSKDATTDHELARVSSLFSLRWTLIISFPIMASLIALADVLIWALFGSEYAWSALPLRVLSGGLILVFMNTVASNILGALGRQDIVAAVVVGDLALTVLLCLLLIPKIGIVGAALAVVLRDAFGFAAMLLALHKNGLPSLG
ncbi:MAG: flippase, partial [Anaerolineae bacterium]